MMLGSSLKMTENSIGSVTTVEKTTTNVADVVTCMRTLERQPRMDRITVKSAMMICLAKALHRRCSDS